MKTLARLALLAACLMAQQVRAGGCRSVEFEDVPYAVCEARADEDVRLFLRSPEGVLLGGFRAINEMLADADGQLAFAMNAGMYHEDRRPVGYFVEHGTEVAPLQRNPGPGNFGLQPNGVFCVRKGRFDVIETLAFDAARPHCLYASQSGPMLVISGALHPKFLQDSDSFNIRNGVGVSADGQTAYFVMSDGEVNFHSFGRFFRDVLKVPDALFFDGTISRLYAPELGRDDFGLPMGPIVGLVTPLAGND